MTSQATAGITRGLADMAVTTRSQAQRQPVGGRTGGRPIIPARRSAKSSPEDDPMQDSIEPKEEPGSKNNDPNSDDSDDPDSSDDSDEDGSESDEGIIKSNLTELEYDVSELNEEGRFRVDVGLNPGPQAVPMFMCYCEDYSNEGYRFRIGELVNIVVGKPGSQAEAPRCTCGVTNFGTACKVSR